MKTGNLLVWGCFLSLLMGASVVSPLMFSAYVVTENEVRFNPQSSTAQIGANIAYAYIVLENTMVPMPGSSDEPKPGQTIKVTLVLNSTKYLNSMEQIPDAEIDYFVIRLYTDEGSIKNLTESVGAAYTTFTKDEMHSNPMDSFSFFRQDWLDLRAGGGGNFWYNWTVGTSRLGGHSSNSGSTNLRQAPLLANAQSVSLSLSRLGEVVFSGNSTVVSKADAGLIEQIQLKKYRDGFLYNTIIPEFMLALMDPLHPIY